MPILDLTETECNQIMTIVGDAPWKIAHPLLMRIGQQLQAQKQPAPPASAPIANLLKPTLPGNGGDMEERHE